MKRTSLEIVDRKTYPVIKIMEFLKQLSENNISDILVQMKVLEGVED